MLLRPVLDHESCVIRPVLDPASFAPIGPVLDPASFAPIGRRGGCQPFLLHMPKIREILNHLLDLVVGMMPQTFSLGSVMGKPSDRPEVPAIIVDDRQVALPTLVNDPVVEILEHVDMPSTGNLH